MKTKKVVYRGHLKRVSWPGNATRVYLPEDDGEIEVPADMVLSPHWEEVVSGSAKKEAKASSKEGEDQ